MQATQVNRRCSGVPLSLSSLEAPVALCAVDGTVTAATPQAATLLTEIAHVGALPSPLPADLWAEIERSEPGEAVQWRAPDAGSCVLGCTRYRCDGGYLLIMKEVSSKNAALARSLHRNRLEATGRLVASVAHELRNAVASIVYSAELLGMAGPTLPPHTMRETIEEMLEGSRQLQSTVDGLLGYARVGPSRRVPVSLEEVMTRAQGFLRSVYREGTHQLTVAIDPSAGWVLGNTLTIEQIFVNLLLNASEAGGRDGCVRVRVFSELALPPDAEPGAEEQVCVRVWDNGPGVPKRFRKSIFEPFFSTRGHGTGLGLPIAIEATQDLGGTLTLEDAGPGACFAVYLPARQEPT